jgi:hypothetical protein
MKNEKMKKDILKNIEADFKSYFTLGELKRDVQVRVVNIL